MTIANLHVTQSPTAGTYRPDPSEFIVNVKLPDRRRFDKFSTTSRKIAAPPVTTTKEGEYILRKVGTHEWYDRVSFEVIVVLHALPA